ncbi:MAG TPA: nucleotidyltransferase domain-containing protein [Geobacterales bacterium]|nr:nucleotidyltransferase domain-containing protein [Geobacterales bacterium]
MGKGKSALESQRKMLELAQEIIEKIWEELPLTEVYTFGSRARWDYLDTSDLDLVFVLKGTREKNVIERMYLLDKYVWGKC